MRLILWAIGCVFAAMAAVQLIIEGMLAAFGGSWAEGPKRRQERPRGIQKAPTGSSGPLRDRTRQDKLKNPQNGLEAKRVGGIFGIFRIVCIFVFFLICWMFLKCLEFFSCLSFVLECLEVWKCFEIFDVFFGGEICF